MTESIKHYFTLALSTFMGPADRGSESHSEYLRRKRAAATSPAGAASSGDIPAQVGANKARAQLEYMD